MPNSPLTKLAAWCLVVVPLGFISLADAQPPSGRGFRGRGPNIPLLLSSLPEVQEELRLSYQQIRLLEALQRDLAAQFRGRGRGTDRERSQPSPEINSKLFATVFNRRQANRFEQLRIQFEGLRALEREEVRVRLKITDEQLDDVRERVRLGADDEETLDSQLPEVLTDEQAAQWDELTGATFEFSEQAERLRQTIRRFGRFRERRSQRPEQEPEQAPEE